MGNKGRGRLLGVAEYGAVVRPGLDARVGAGRVRSEMFHIALGH
jgi:hypothetical protein